MINTRVKVTSKDAGAKATRQRLAHLAAAPAVEVGVLGEKAEATHGEDGSGISVGAIAEIHEYGLGVPERSWLRAWVDGNRGDIAKRISGLAKAAAAGRITPPQAAAQLGMWCVGQIQKRIASGIGPELADATIARKGSSVPLIDKGQLRQSVTSRVVPR